VANGTLQGVVSRSHLMQILQARSELQAARYPQLHGMKQKGVNP